MTRARPNHELTSSYDYNLPPELIAAYPPKVRGASRMLYTDPTTETLRDDQFCNIINYLRPRDLLVLNNAKVIPARIHGRKETGGRVEVFVVGLVHPLSWEELTDVVQFQAMTRSSNRLKVGTKVRVETAAGDDLGCMLEVVGFEAADGGRLAVVEARTDTAGTKMPQTPSQLLQAIGEVPLPPYILKQREDEAATDGEGSHAAVDDRVRYQNVFAKVPGAVAAPTAGLHFTSSLLDNLQQHGVGVHYLTLEVGPGTFKPVSAERLLEHPMHSEFYCIDESLSDAIRETKSSGGRVVAVGTTSMRVLEAEARRPTPFLPGRRSTDIFINPMNPPRLCDGLLTNFHLPKSTLFALVAGMISLEFAHEAYAHAVDARYRFYSYGDCMLILPSD